MAVHAVIRPMLVVLLMFPVAHAQAPPSVQLLGPRDERESAAYRARRLAAELERRQADGLVDNVAGHQHRDL